MERTEHINSNVEAVVFLDRDGTIIKEKGIIHDPSLIELERGAVNALRQLNELSIPVFIITNQPGISKGIINDYALICDCINEMLESHHVKVDGIFTCPHTGDEKCNCRKPKNGLIQEALYKSKLRPKRIYTVGDRLHDVDVARRVGGTGILVRTGYGEVEMRTGISDFGREDVTTAEDIEDAVRMIIMMEHKQGRKVLPVPQYRWPCVSADMERVVLEQLYESVSIRSDTGVIAALEQEWMSFTNRRYAIAYSSGTMAMFAAYMSVGVGKGDEIIVPAYGYFATVSPALLCGASIRFVDVDESGNPSIEAIERAINKNTKAIVIAHLYGALSNVSGIKELANKNGLVVIEDASHSVGANNAQDTACNCGDVAICSLQANKLAPAGEGGILLTDNAEIIKRAATVGHFKQYSSKYVQDSDELFPFLTTGMGIKLRIHPVAAAIGISSIRKINEVRKGRRECAYKMMEVLSKSGIHTTASIDELSLYTLPLKLPDHCVGKKDILSEIIRNKGLTSDFNHNSNAVMPNLPIFRTPNIYFPSHTGIIDGKYPNAERFEESIFLLPLWHKEYEYEIGMVYARELSCAVDSLIN